MVAPTKVPLSVQTRGPLPARTDELPFPLDLRRDQTGALHAQLARQIREAVLSGLLPGGTPL
ncbi:hypothetical protein IHN63_05085, partial [Deinococcus sp. 6YEL10]|uniref:hypothetical protein n=1 Tax=Deinococcus sp. 6YEL10 TaxID=2745870 RepID=UPI00351D5786|nr:hypothetical protein [Deinococcus sp. 6YEL10]